MPNFKSTNFANVYSMMTWAVDGVNTGYYARLAHLREFESLKCEAKANNFRHFSAL